MEPVGLSSSISHSLGASGGKKSEFLEKIKSIAARVFYVLSHPSYALRQIRMENLFKIRKNLQVEPFMNPQYGGYGIYGSDFKDLNLESIHDSKNRFHTFNLPTQHKTLGIFKESHNVTLLYDKEKSFLYIIDGKANNPSELHLENQDKSENPQTVQGFVELLKGDLGITQVAKFEVPLQRTNDCVIFPEKVIGELIKQENPESPQFALDVVLKQANTDPLSFYKDINDMRDAIFKKPTYTIYQN